MLASARHVEGIAEPGRRLGQVARPARQRQRAQPAALAAPALSGFGTRDSSARASSRASSLVTCASVVRAVRRRAQRPASAVAGDRPGGVGGQGQPFEPYSGERAHRCARIRRRRQHLAGAVALHHVDQHRQIERALAREVRPLPRHIRAGRTPPSPRPARRPACAPAAVPASTGRSPLLTSTPCHKIR